MSKSKRSNLRIQAAIDFLNTYGWALLIIAIVLIILIYLHVFNSSTFVSNVCESQNNIYCNKAILNTSGKVLVQITSDHQNPINITAIACSNNLNNLIFQNVTPQVTLEPGQSVELAVTCYDNGNPFIGKTGSIYSGYVVVKYYDIFTDFPGVSNLAVTLHSTPELISTTSVSTTISTTSTSTTSTSTTSTTTIPVPSGIQYYANITLSNNQNQPTPDPFQQEIVITSSSPLWNYINTGSNAGDNVEFFYFNNQTIIPSWLQSINSSEAVFWVKIGSIPANSNKVISIGFGSKTTNFFNGNNVGEAAQLSPTFGEYDNIQNVMNPGLIYQIYYCNSEYIVPNPSDVYQAQLYDGYSSSFGTSCTFSASTQPFLTAVSGSTQNVNGNTENYVIDNYQYGYSGGTGFPNPPVANELNAYVIKQIGFIHLSNPTVFYVVLDDGGIIGYSGNAPSSFTSWLGGSSNPANLINEWKVQGANEYSSSTANPGDYAIEYDYANMHPTQAYFALWSNNPVDYYSAAYPPDGVEPSYTFGTVNKV
ncbi:MAG: hypothetical protein ARM1_0713 [Candidatus Micrarchaeota archaeon]|nr:MAG: hypothetical protein ARM1_0713 [Candidatus Micrarchaeota archaeon]